MIDAAGCGAPSSPSGGALAGAAWDLAAQRTVGGVAGGVVPGGGVGGGGGGGGTGFMARTPPQSCRAEYTRITAGRTPAVTDQDLRRLVAWLGNRRHLAGVMAKLSLPARHRRLVVAVEARGGILLGYGVAPEGARTPTVWRLQKQRMRRPKHTSSCVLLLCGGV
jgi:hypothetical protein